MTDWKSLDADGCSWQVRSIPAGAEAGQADADRDVLEFRSAEGNRPPRRLAVDRGALQAMDEEALRAAYLQARPIGGDYYGRPGKTMPDVS